LFARLARGMLCAADEDFQKARAAYESALKINPNQPTVLNNLAYLLVEQLGLPAEALPYAKHAAKISPNDPNTLDTYGWVEAKNGMYGEAAGTLMRALDLDGRNLDALVHLGLVHIERKEYDDALRRLNYAESLVQDELDAINKAKGEKGGPPSPKEQALLVQLPKIKEGLERISREGGRGS